MKRFWQTCLAVVATAAIANTANAQWDESAEIGSYQSILARAGYGDSMAPPPSNGAPVSYNPYQAVPAPPGAAMAVQVDNGANGCGGGGVAAINCGGACGSPDCGSGAMNGQVGSGVGSNGCGTGNYLDSGSCGTPVYSPGNSVGNGLTSRLGGLGGSDNSNYVVGLFGISFRRDYDDGQRIARNGAGTAVYTDDLDHGNIGGLGVSIAKRDCNGSGWEAILWGLDEEDDLRLAGGTTTYLTGLSAVAHPPSGGTVQDIYDAGTDIRVIRDTDILNLEFNLLRNGGQYTTRWGNSANYELMGGFRLFNFDESFRYVSYGVPATIEYRLEAENSLAGFQLGGRNEICLSDRVRLATGGSAGVFNNYIQTRQQIIDSNAYSALDYSDTKNDAAFLGQIDLGLIYQFSQKSRVRIGYRALGVAGVALAEDQIPLDFTDVRALTSANSNGSLLLHGFYYGCEFCY